MLVLTGRIILCQLSGLKWTPKTNTSSLCRSSEHLSRQTDDEFDEFQFSTTFDFTSSQSSPPLWSVSFLCYPPISSCCHFDPLEEMYGINVAGKKKKNTRWGQNSQLFFIISCFGKRGLRWMAWGRRLKQTSLWKWKLQFCQKLDKLNWWQDGKKRISLSSQEMTSATDTITEVKEKDNLPVHTLQFNCWGKKATRPVRANSANIIKDPAGPTFCTFSIPN